MLEVGSPGTGAAGRGEPNAATLPGRALLCGKGCPLLAFLGLKCYGEELVSRSSPRVKEGGDVFLCPGEVGRVSLF